MRTVIHAQYHGPGYYVKYDSHTSEPEPTIILLHSSQWVDLWGP
jgi:hypothetical protein